MTQDSIEEGYTDEQLAALAEDTAIFIHTAAEAPAEERRRLLARFYSQLQTYQVPEPIAADIQHQLSRAISAASAEA